LTGSGPGEAPVDPGCAARYDGSTGDCDPSTHNCGTTIKVELDERTVD